MILNILLVGVHVIKTIGLHLAAREMANCVHFHENLRGAKRGNLSF